MGKKTIDNKNNNQEKCCNKNFVCFPEISVKNKEKKKKTNEIPEPYQMFHIMWNGEKKNVYLPNFGIYTFELTNKHTMQRK